MWSILLVTPFILTIVSAQMTTTASLVARQMTATTPATAALQARQVVTTAPPTTGSLMANAPASANAAAVSAAAAESAADAAAFGTAAATGNFTDACGPAVPDPSVPDSCDTPVLQVDSPAAYGVQCLNDTLDTAPINITSCATLIQEMCGNQWQRPGQWLWLTANGCSVGSFLPPQTYVGAAPWPTAAQCEELIFASMVDECQYSGVAYNIAAVNLKTLPADQGGDKGTSVNVGYGSYLVSSRQQRTFSDDPNCEYIPPDNYCKGSGCFPPAYYVSKYSKPTPCYALGSLAPSFTPL